MHSEKPEAPARTSPNPGALFLVWTEDLFLVPRLTDAVRALAGRVWIADRPEALGAGGLAAARTIPLTEPLEGADAALVRRIAEEQPALILVDTGCQAIPWERCIQILKTSAATRRIPIVAFGPHVEGDTLARAHRAGADLAVSRRRLQSALPEILSGWASSPDLAALEQACREPLSAAAEEGLRLIGECAYFHAHEVLEQAWREAPGPAGNLYRALLQVAVSYLHIERDNYRGAAKVLLRLHQWLDPLPDVCRQVDVAELRRQVDTLRQAVQRAGPQGLADLDRRLLAPIPMA